MGEMCFAGLYLPPNHTEGQFHKGAEGGFGIQFKS